jgi:putative membrane protein
MPVANHNTGGGVAPLDATQLAVERTRLAHERTLMAWVRTATSLISFGFTIYKFFQYLHEASPGSHPARLLGSREFALLMIFIGLVTLVIAALEHRHSMQRLRAQGAAVPYSLALVLAVLIAGLGVLGLCIVIFRQ